MKAILVIDMPTHCGECPVKCRMRGINHVPSWCPLKPLPDGVTEEETGAYVKGYMDALVSEVDDESNISGR